MSDFLDNFKTIYIKYYPKLRRFAQTYVLREADAENIVHDVFTDIWDRKIVFRDQSKVLSYLLSAVRNRCLDFIRRESLHRVVSNKLQYEYYDTLKLNYEALSNFDLSFCEAEEDILKKVEAAIDNLPEKCKLIFTKSKIEGYKNKEIARELNISVHTVENQMAIAYKKLREELKYIFPFIYLFF